MSVQSRRYFCASTGDPVPMATSRYCSVKSVCGVPPTAGIGAGKAGAGAEAGVEAREHAASVSARAAMRECRMSPVICS